MISLKNSYYMLLKAKVKLNMRLHRTTTRKRRLKTINMSNLRTNPRKKRLQQTKITNNITRKKHNVRSLIHRLVFTLTNQNYQNHNSHHTYLVTVTINLLCIILRRLPIQNSPQSLVMILQRRKMVYVE